MSELSDFLSTLSDTLDKPGRAVRGILGGQTGEALAAIPFSDSLGLTDPKNAVSGEDLAHQWFGLDKDSTGGQIAGFGLSAALDPTNLLGLGLGSRAARGAAFAARGVDEATQAARASNALREGLLAKGAMPAEIAAQTTLKDAAGNPLRTYHGTSFAYDKPDFARMDKDALYGPGYYTTADPEIASSYVKKEMDNAWRQTGSEQDIFDTYKKHFNEDAWKYRTVIPPAYENDPAAVARSLGAKLKDNPGSVPEELASALSPFFAKPQPNLRMQYMDMRNPFDIDRKIPYAVAAPLMSQVEGPKASLGARLLESKSIGGGVYGDELYGLLRLAAGGKTEANEVLRKAGFDGITHTGGRNIGTVDHPVAIAFNNEQVYKPWVAPAEAAIPAPYAGPSPGRSLLLYLAGVLGNTGAASQATTRRPQTIRDMLLSLPRQDQSSTGGAVEGF